MTCTRNECVWPGNEASTSSGPLRRPEFKFRSTCEYQFGDIPLYEMRSLGSDITETYSSTQPYMNISITVGDTPLF